jgi:pyruvate, orthophosphate dikinase
MASGTDWIRTFAEGSAQDKDLLGGKGANLAEMTRMGLPVPPGFIVTTEACRAYLGDDGALPSGLMDQVRDAMSGLEEQMGRRYGDPANPLLLSVRSGARFSMPGMMDTLLNLGLTEATRAGLAATTGNPRLAADAHRRFLELFSRVVLDLPERALEAAARNVLSRHGASRPDDLDADGMADLADAYEQVLVDAGAAAVIADPWAQLEAAIEAVFRSWNGRRARDYRRMEGIADDLGTAVNIQAMVFGNAGDDSGTGVAFTRDPATGDRNPVGDFLVNAQGEDVVAGTHATRPLADLRDVFPDCAAELDRIMQELEQHYQDMCDVEFTIERGRLFMLQTRVGKRSALASLRMAVDMADEGLIKPAEAVNRFRPEQLDRLLHPQFDPSASYQVLATGLPASPGAASGAVVFDSDEAVEREAAGEDVILVRTQTSPEDLHGMVAARGVLTSRGGLVSHAAVVARGIGKPAVCGADDVVIHGDRFRVGDVEVAAGDIISLDGTSGEVVLGSVPVVEPEMPPELERMLSWADEIRTLGVWANADTGADATVARANGAEGIGLCRTEHQFLGDRLPVVQDAILARDADTERVALDRLYEVQRADFVDLLTAMDGLPVTVRLLDPPLHEFLPHVHELRVAQATVGLDEREEALLDAATAWDEDNPMLGVRGVRLGLLRPKLYGMQVRALADAALERQANGGTPLVRIMIPLVAEARELELALDQVREVLDEACAAAGDQLSVQVGAMVETPRACLTMLTIAPLVDFLSFGTNDLTQMTFGFSRDDVAARLLPLYLDRGILPADPFGTLDLEGVGQLVAATVAAARAANSSVEIGVCGEHGGDPASIDFFHRTGLDEVSCSPPRVPVARLAAAQAALT